MLQFFFVDDVTYGFAYHFGNQFPELILQYGSSDYISNYIQITKNNNKKRKRGIDEACEDNNLNEIIPKRETIVDLSIHLHESQYPMLAERLFKDLQNGEFYNVFGNEALKSPSMLQKFIAILNEKSYNDLYYLLMCELKISSKVPKCKYEPEKYSDEVKKYTKLRMFAHDFLIDERFIKRRHGGLYPYMSSVRGIKWVILFGHYQILHFILNQMIQIRGNVNDLFLNCYNKRHQLYSNVNQINTGTEENSLLNHSMIGESFIKPDNVREDHKADIDTDNDIENCSNNDTDIDLDSYKGSDQDVDAYSFIDSDSDSEIACDTYKEPVIVEQCRLLCLSCYSGDLITVQILLKHVNTDALNSRVWPSRIAYFKKNPLIIACKYGYLDIVMELLKAGADVNIYVETETPLLAACENGHRSIVRELLKWGASVNTENWSYTPLQSACQERQTLLVEELIKAGADVNLNTPIIDACKQGDVCIVKILIKAGADVNRSSHNIDHVRRITTISCM